MDQERQQDGRFREPIAVIGSGCRFPGASSSPSKLWELLQQPRDALKEFDPERLNLSRFHHKSGDTHGATDVGNKSYLLEEDTRLFDAAFFGISPVEAAGMDPQQRILLEAVYEAFESAGMTLDELRGSFTSVHVGCMTSDWANIQARDTETVPKYNATGSANSILSNRISYIFDLKGPSETIDTACSSSLVALHNAARGLLNGDCNAAVVAGVNLILDPAPYINESKLHMLSPDARSRMWDKAANGYARGEGAGALLLKKLSQALKDGDHIEGLVRATGVNSDGQSPGITMPFSPTQTALIQETYARAGLDPIKDRPQYIECHGTGTPAGDPVEAQALSNAFIGQGDKSTENPIFVGSIKTVIGHLEGGAGIAGVIKVLLSIKHRVIPPNLLFKDLNPDIAPYYGPLQIPTTAVPWPKLPPGTPARASVNSFGFGGTNSHAIIESFEEGSVPRPNSAEEGIVGPLLFSAKSGASLLRSVRDNLEYMHKDPSLDLRDLSALLQSRRTTHRCRAHFSGSSRDAILEKMADFVKIHEKSASDQIGHQPQLINPKEVPGVLGVFTGQGAQWPSMGRELIQKSSLFRKYIQECEAVLNALPEKDRPKWSLTEELMKDAASSRIAEAALSQPLCSAVQLALVKLLQAAGIKFDAVVGHSSGEIAATFAAGIITLQGAMQIAYYRGLHAKSAGGANGAKGAMMAAGLSFVEAKQFCSRSEFDGRIKVAASNAPKSVTLSGDLDAITKAHEILQADNVFARRLQVDTAYHSHHMLPCSQPYLKSLLACNIKVMQPTGKCTWVSSVRGDTQLLRGDLSSLKGQYWVDNMVRTVLFTQAIESSIWHGGPFDLAIEVGPHPALKGPTEQTLKASYGALPVYTGVLKRGGNDVEAFSSAIGTAWAQLGPAFVDFAGYRSLFYKAGTPALRIPKGLPTYSWDHDKVFWREGRLSRRFRLGNDQGHELLGRRTLDDNDTELRWRNVLKLSEMPWLRGHEVLGEVLLPGASYVSIAVQAGQSIAATMGKGVRLIEVSNINILRPVVVPEGVDGVETLFTTRIVETTKDHILAEFTYYVCPDESLGSMLQTCNGDILVYLETQSDFASQDTLPPKGAMPSNLTSIDTERVYSLFKDIGLNYSGLFRGITTIDRQLDYASTKSTWAEGLDSAYVVHPAMLDVAFQTMFIAKAHPASRQISSALLPSHIDRVRINPSVQFAQPSGGAETAAEFETWAVKQTANSLVGDLNVYDAATGKTFLQVEGLAVNSVGEQDSSSDRSMFSRTLWGQDVTLGLPDPIRDPVKDAEGLQMAHAVERVALFYVKNILKEVGQEERAGFQWYHQRMFEAFEEHVRVVKSGEHPIILPEWLDDEASILDELDAKHGETIDFKLLHAVGKDLADVVRGNKQMLEVMTKDDMLNRFYMEGYASVPTNKAVGDVMRQLSFKFPRARILEIGAGTGGTSWSVLNCIDDAYESYTYTDVSSGFFHLAEEKFAKFAHKMIFKVLDIEQEPKEQGFEEQSYDIIVAALVLHATHDLEKTMRHARSLLKPGGFLVMVELTGTMSVRATLVMGGLPGWWLGENDGRRLSPLVTAVEWDRLLQDTGFSGADAVIHDLADEEKHCTALIMGQAVDDDFQRLRSPLSTVAELPLPTDPIVVIGGKRLSTSKVVREIQKLLPKKWARHTLAYKSIDEIDVSKVTPSIDILSLQDFDEPPFSHTVTAHRMAIIHGDELFIIGGRSESSWVVAITNVNASIAQVDETHVFPIEEKDCTPDNLSAIANYVLSWAVTTVAAPYASVLLFEADDSLAASVKAELAAVGSKTILASTHGHGHPTNDIKIHALASKRAIQRLVPRDVQLYIDCSLGASPAAATLAQSMPSKCIVRQLSADLVQEALRGAAKPVAELLGEACASSDIEATAVPLIPAAKLAGAGAISLKTQPYITDWKTQVSISTTIQPLNLDGLFKPDKTYFMAGMAGGLGLSICQWMIRNGAKHMVITSRRPQVDEATLEEAERVGATVKVLAMDLTNKDSVEKVVREVRDTMPPIAGVCNAAMVLKDGFFVDMDVDQFNNTLAAKVIGSENLDAVFNDAPLDFFILLGSVASVIGNVGQSNYHAANLFMTSLVHQRRARGLAASIIHIAYVTDVGYVTREERDRQLDSHFRKVRLMPTSETDVHHAFAEAVKGGKPESTSGYYDIIMGIEPLREQIPSDQQPLWMKNPRFAHFDQHAIHAQNDRSSTGSTENVRALVEKAEQEEEAIDAVMAAFCTKLESILQLTAGSINVQRPITDLGIDSLVAVEIRTWFLKELGADVPVVKILGGDTVQQLSTIATKKLLAKNMEAGAEKKSTTEKPAEAAAPVPTSKQEESISSNSSYTKDETPDSDDKSERSVSVADDKADEMRIRPEILREERMSPAQARLWFMSQHLENSSAYNMAFRYRVKGPIGIARLKHALSVTTYNHECLRMCFYSRLEDGQPMQGLMASSLYQFNHIVNASDADVDREMSRLSTRKWDLEYGHTMEVSLISRSSEDHDMIIAYHHIVMDSMGLGIVLNDLNSAYNMRPLNRSAGSYMDFSVQQLEQQTRGEFDEQLSFWEAEFKTIPETLPRLPFANISGAPGDEPVPDTYHQYRELNDAQFASLKATCQQLRISPFHFHLALLQVLLSRYTNTEDLCIGVVDANRNNHQYAGTVGCFVNMVPVRLHMPLGKTGFADVAQHTRQSALRALEHSTVPFDMIIDKIKIPRSSGSTPLFQAALNYRTGSLWEMPLGQAKMTMADVKDANNPYDLSLGIAETRTGCMVEFYVSSSAYSSEACCTIMDAYMRLLDDFSSNPDLQIGNCNVYDKSGIESSLKVGKGPVITFGWPATLSQRFLDMVRRHHEDAAVTDKTSTLTYAELMERVNAVCDTLVRYGCGSGSHIAVLCEPSIDTIVSMLAILHIGAVYVPLDVSLPTARHVAMIHSSKPSLIVSHSTTDGLARDCIDKVDFPIRRVVLDDIPDEEVRVTVPCVASPDTCSVILFTSGSTGTPKGIMLSQANFVNHLALKTHLLGLGKETVLQQSSTGFDMSMIQMFCALANGGRLVIAPFEIRRDPIEMASLIRSEQISLSIATPSEYLAWTRYGASSLKENTAWRHICMGGEPVTRQLVLELRRLGLPNLRVTNCYGPTEITAAASFHTVDLGSQGNLNADTVKYTVGKVLPNYTVSILDVSGSPQPVNYTGEICIGGAGVALGYVNASGDAASNFIVTAQGQRMYRTGDRGRLLSDGTLLLFGRIDGDAQIKLRGLRIDLQEVELAVLEAANGLLSTVVVSQRGDVLIAHATVSADKAAAGSVTDDDLTGVLRRLTLPQYFIPARIITLSSLPTNANGKLDRKAIAALPLPQTQFTAGPTSSEEKMTVGEGELRLLWERVLPQAASSARISPSSDFFLLGGNSLLLMKLQAAIKDSMNVIMSTRKLYQASTLRDMARAVDEQRRSQTENDAELEIDWAAETAIPKWLLNQIHELSNSNHFTRSKLPVEKISVLMTGATTFLGGHLLKSLLQSDTVSQIYCVAVPADDQKLLPEDEKIECFTGSLLSPTLGLNAAERERLESVADVIVHAGGSGHCLNTYATLRTPNVVSTQFLASMALPRSIPLLFLSSNRVVLLTGNTSPPAASVSAFPPATDGREGHMMSKWTSEVFLENLVSHLQGSSLRHQQKPWTVAVHRPSVIVSENAPNSDALNAILRYSILMQSSPRMDNVRGYLDLAQLDTVVAELCQSVIQLGSGQSNQESTDIIFKHHSGGVKVPATELWSHLEKVYGVTFDEVEMDEWLRRAAKAGIDPLITAYLEAIQSNGAKMIFPYMGSD
ncbi:polyketide synthase [Trichoderma citrinoviride]|uniref:Polyketide synthase n=1 Tax=Trichoderma citrinoviride TaxID=58853 RepID=A0A2T4AXB2_9HYPO|nr:polyketide synthase [Trichoderma citrinoviride]PTB61706.1 polyketide synthase [Trichoderma citrinoviride]